jgi:hypothetical protein
MALAASGGKPGFPTHESRSMRTAQGTQIDGGQRFLGDQIHYSEGAVGSEAVVGYKGGLAICGRSDFMRVMSGRDSRDHLQT